MNGDVFRQLQEADWATIGKALTYYALWRSTLYPRRTAGSGELGLGQTAEDIAQTVIRQALSDERHWDPDKGELLPWLKRQVDSVMDHLFQSRGYRRETHLEVKDDQGQILVETRRIQQYELNVARVEQAPNLEPSWIEEDDEREHARAVKEMVGRLFEAADDDPELEPVMEAILEGCDPKPKALAARLSLPVHEVNNRLKRLRRRALPLKLERPQRSTHE